MQLLAGFRGLYALHLISLRCPSDRSMTLHNESLNFAVDSLSHCGEMKLKYIALTNQVIALESRPKQFPKRFKTLMGRRKDKKGKGKEPASALHDLMNQMDDSGSDDIDDVLSNMWAGETKLKFTTRFADVKDVKIFTKEIRSGRL